MAYGPHLNCASRDHEQVMANLNEVFKNQQASSLATMLSCTSQYGVERRIVAAATIVDGGAMLIGSRHYCPMMHAQSKAMGLSKSMGRLEGFIDQYDVWVDRELAYDIVQANGQPFDPERNRSSKSLYSEGVW